MVTSTDLTGVMQPQSLATSPPAIAGAGGLAGAAAPAMSPSTTGTNLLQGLPPGLLNFLLSLRLGGQQATASPAPAAATPAPPPAATATMPTMPQQNPLAGGSSAAGAGLGGNALMGAAAPPPGAAAPTTGAPAPTGLPGGGAATFGVGGPGASTGGLSGGGLPSSFFAPSLSTAQAPVALPPPPPPPPTFSNELGMTAPQSGGFPITQAMLSQTPPGMDPMVYWANMTPTGSA